MKIIAYLKPTCGWSMGVRAIMKKYDLEFEDRDIINNADQYAEMVEKSGQPLSPCVEIDGHMLADVSGDEVEAYMLKEGLVSENGTAADAPTNAACTEGRQEAMRSMTVSFVKARSMDAARGCNLCNMSGMVRFYVAD